MKELRDDLQAKEVTVQALKSKIAELYVEVQTTLQNKMEADSEARTARNDLVVLVKAKEWYQEQLSVAHEVRAKLQQQLTHLQAQTMSQVKLCFVFLFLNLINCIYYLQGRKRNIDWKGVEYCSW